MKEAGMDVSHIGGTQYAIDGADRAMIRAKIPHMLCEHIVDICEQADSDIPKLDFWQKQKYQMSLFD
jgi:hypothetical protein